jgi:Tol biopolymer transport system component
VVSCCLVLSSPVAEAKVPGTNGRIAFSRYDATLDDTVTYTADADGSHQQQLLPGYSSASPHWSPDGSSVAVTSGLGGVCPPTCTSNTVIIDPVTGNYRILTPAGYPAVLSSCSIWSPDGTRFVCDGENDSDPTVNGLYLIRASDGGGLTRVTTATGQGDDLPIDFSPDGTQLVFGHTGPFHTCDRTSALFVINVDGSGLRRITPWGFCDDDGGWSPDGSRIGFVLDSGSVYTVRPDGTGLTRLPLTNVAGTTNSRTYGGDVSWSPDGSQLVLILTGSTGRGTFQEGIATANADGTGAHWITNSPTKDTQPDWGSAPGSS